MRLQVCGQEPCGDVEIFVVRLGQVAAVASLGPDRAVGGVAGMR